MKVIIISFLLGFLAALIIFGVYFPIFPSLEINYSIPASWPEFLTATGTLLAVIIALFGEWIRSKIFPSKIRLIDIWQNIQNDQGHTRLLFRNVGYSTAYEVEIYVSKIFDAGKERLGFLPVPLIWTHTADTTTKRDFHPKQFGYYLDLCRINDINNSQIEPHFL